jgi:hypothetical protein
MDRRDTHRTTMRDGCTIGDLVAIDGEGGEVARHNPSLCVTDPQPAWAIREDGATPAP